jgi:fatty acid desaturase
VDEEIEELCGVDAGVTRLPSQLVHELSDRSFLRWLGPTALEWVQIVALFAIGFWVDRWAIWAVIVVLMGSRQNALGVLGHDGAHYLISRHRQLNELASELLCFWPVMTGIADFRRFHFAHHRYLSSERDPEIIFKTKLSPAQWAVPAGPTRIFGYFALDLIGLGAIEIAKAYRLMKKTQLRSVIGPLCWWTAVGAVLHVFHLELAALIWFLSLGTSFWGFYRLRSWTEHVGDDAIDRVRANWWQRWLITPHCSWAHDEHHRYPSVVFWQRHRLRSSSAPGVPMVVLFESFSDASKFSTPEPGDEAARSGSVTATRDTPSDRRAPRR